MLIIQAKKKSVTYSIDRIGDVENAVNEIERIVLESNKVSGELASVICGELNLLRDALQLPQGVKRHPKFAETSLQE